MPPIAQAPYNAVKQAQSLFADVNKAHRSLGNNGDLPMDEYESSMKEEEILSLTDQWKQAYSAYYRDIERTQEIAYNYWIGKQMSDTQDAIEGRLLVDNLMFQAFETFLPIATRSNPDPVVSTDSSPEGQKLSYDMKNMLVFQADKQKLRMVLKHMTRDWGLNRIGVAKVEWDVKDNDIRTVPVKAKNMIFDRDGYVGKGGLFHGEYLGEKLRLSASKLIEMFPKKSTAIRLKSNDKMATKLDIIMWWYKGTDVFFTLDKDIVLGKFKNPNWNYDGEIKRLDPNTGLEISEPIRGRNHMSKPLAPYVFLTVFNTRVQPHDDTSLILQNISIQDLINKRMRQIDKNVESQNNGIVVSEVFTSEQASMAASALRKGGAIRVPAGDVTKAFMRDSAPALPGDVYQNLNDARTQLQNIFGTSGSNPQGVSSEDTARGKILTNQLDSSRIGGGVTEHIEGAADSIYNFWVQFMYVYYDEPHYASAIGIQGAQEVIQLHNQDLNRTIMVTVKDGSLIPKDPLTERNEAVDLWSANAIDPITLYTKLDFPDPYNAAKQLLLWQLIAKGGLPPQVMFPDFPQPSMPVIPGAQGGLPGQPQIPSSGGGTGGPAVNSPNPPQGMIQNPPPPLESPQAVQDQGRQLLQSIPIK